MVKYLYKIVQANFIEPNFYKEVFSGIWDGIIMLFWLYDI